MFMTLVLSFHTNIDCSFVYETASVDELFGKGDAASLSTQNE